jgi:hypothetical protein
MPPPKPDKPYKDFPLHPHSNGQGAKKIRGKRHYLGVRPDPERARGEYRNDNGRVSSGSENGVGMSWHASVLTDHSDRGSQYCSASFQKALSREGIECSMSRKGHCWDNAVNESFFATLKKELVHPYVYADPDAARASIFEYIEVFYNRVRRYSALSGLSPEQYEQHG